MNFGLRVRCRWVSPQSQRNETPRNAVCGFIETYERPCDSACAREGRVVGQVRNARSGGAGRGSHSLQSSRVHKHNFLCTVPTCRQKEYRERVSPYSRARTHHACPFPKPNRTAWPRGSPRVDLDQSILSPGQGWHRRANAQKRYKKAPLTGKPIKAMPFGRLGLSDSTPACTGT